MSGAHTRSRRLAFTGIVVVVLAVAHLGLSYWLYDLDDILANRALAGVPDGPTGPAHVTPLRDGIFLIGVAGTNVVAAIGEEGMLLVDTAEATDTERVEAAIDELTDLPVRYIINTHPHADHIEGNVHFAQDGADVIATRAAADNILHEYSASGDANTLPHGAVPNVTFEGFYKFRFAGHTIEIVEVPDSHSDGDAVVHFVEANVVVAGDLFINEGLPYISLGRGRTIDGYLEGMLQVIAVVDNQSMITPGHGPVGDTARLVETRDRLAAVRDAVAFRKGLGLPLRLTFLTYPAHDWPVRWQRYGVARKWFVKAVYRSLQ